MTVNEAKKILLAADLDPLVREALCVLSPDLDFQNLPDEEWRDIVDEANNHKGAYQISNFGRVRSFKQGKVKLLRIDTSAESGYVYVYLYSNGKRDSANSLVHILVAKAFVPNPDNKPQVNHIDGDKSNNCAWNLEWVTPSENIRHAYKMGLVKNVRNHRRFALSHEQVREIRRNCVPGDPERGINAFAKKFNVNATAIRFAYYGKSYQNVE